jgi:hypothetical protein
MRVTMIKSDVRAREKPCLRCGYSLRKIDSTHCPECGLSVWLSLNQNDTLEWSNPGWLRRMSSGLWVMAGAQALAFVAYALMLVHMVPEFKYRQQLDRVQRAAMTGDERAVEAAAAAVQLPPPADFALIRTAILLAAVYLVAYHAGLLLLTRSEQRYPDRTATPRAFAYVVSGLAGLVALAMLAWAVSPTTLSIFGNGLKVLAIASGLVTWTYLRAMAKRVPNATLARIAAWLMLVPLLSVLKVFPFFAFFIAHEFWWLLDLIAVVYIPFSAVLFVWYARIFTRAAASAEQSWSAETALTR